MMTNVLQLYRYINDELADDRTKDWMLISSPLPTALVTLSYLYFVLKCGPRYMKNRRPYSCLKFIKFYNILQIAMNSCMVYATVDSGWYREIFFKCAGLEYATDRKSMQYISIGWYYMVIKMTDYIETIVFVLRKKQEQITFLHLYHHVALAVLGWYETKYCPNGQILTAMVTNCMVHVIMYTYYLLSSMGPTVRIYTNYAKPWITRIQMVQFAGVIMYTVGYSSICDTPVTPTILLLILVLTNFVLFYNFYKRAYTKAKKNK